ncbi:cysteine methyltransferase [Candidatus Beckwithbacteria bacterium CG10_big_fil_rev_8_21_14_0_10_34_10]|uniref:Cysteine methyltransferase n=1 Tax=Candidatus Beckwithbacteria bacterium CG10_big_fil_rev_8_21_14_0_10_34_10 TaxID=1974495 RepID=A0A2H0WAZ8_9BACT|nr:MAG: cysteine methyltransferase [Candidatus Beckwithbacteria bacterium CG10_big_fil_rev_8_21_14_0_10_34_10]
MSPFSKKVYQLTKQVPKGKVTTYKQIAKALNTKAYQEVGQALRNNPYAPKVPCHRVIKTNGLIGGFNGKTKGKEILKKISLLKKEGVKIKENKVLNFKTILFTFS